MSNRTIEINTAWTQDTYNGKAQSVICKNCTPVEVKEHEFRASADVYLMNKGFKYEVGGFDGGPTYYSK